MKTMTEYMKEPIDNEKRKNYRHQISEIIVKWSMDEGNINPVILSMLTLLTGLYDITNTPHIDPEKVNKFRDQLTEKAFDISGGRADQVIMALFLMLNQLFEEALEYKE